VSPLARVCSWCGRSLGASYEGEGETHGICPTCLAEALRERQEALSYARRFFWWGTLGALLSLSPHRRWDRPGGLPAVAGGQVMSRERSRCIGVGRSGCATGFNASPPLSACEGRG
jgi:hypothetical protein